MNVQPLSVDVLINLHVLIERWLFGEQRKMLQQVNSTIWLSSNAEKVKVTKLVNGKKHISSEFQPHPVPTTHFEKCFSAAEGGCELVLRALLQNDYRHAIQTRDGDSLIHACLRAIIEQQSLAHMRPRQLGETPGAFPGHVGVLRALLEVGGRGGKEGCITLIVDKTSLSTLSWAVLTGHFEIVKMLLEVGQINLVMICPFPLAKTALDQAMCMSHVKMGTLLLQFGGEDLYNLSFFRDVNNVRKHIHLEKEEKSFLQCCLLSSQR